MLTGIRTGVSGSPADRGQYSVVSVISNHTQKGWKCHIVALTLPSEDGWQGITWHQWREWMSIKQVNGPSVGLLMFSRKMGNEEKWEKGCNDPRFFIFLCQTCCTYAFPWCGHFYFLRTVPLPLHWTPPCAPCTMCTAWGWWWPKGLCQTQ